MQDATECARRKEGMYIVRLQGSRQPVLGWWREHQWASLYWGESRRHGNPHIVTDVLAGPITVKQMVAALTRAAGKTS